MGNFTIVQNRNGCIGCGLCHALSDKTWKMNDEDGKADLMGAIENNGLMKAEFSDDLLEVNKQIADACPAQVIQVEGYND